MFVFVLHLQAVAIRPLCVPGGLLGMELPLYWKGFVHGPRVDWGVKFEEFEFASRTVAMLRGWLISQRGFCLREYWFCLARRLLGPTNISVVRRGLLDARLVLSTVRPLRACAV